MVTLEGSEYPDEWIILGCHYVYFHLFFFLTWTCVKLRYGRSCKSMPLIKVDDRECNEKLLSTLRQEKDFTLQICRLPIGDYQVDDILLVERKAVRDMIASIKDGRWFRQAIKLSALPIQSMVILEGTSLNYKSIGMKREAIQGALISLSLLFKIPLIRSRTPEETAKLIHHPVEFVKKVQENNRKALPEPKKGWLKAPSLDF